MSYKGPSSPGLAVACPTKGWLFAANTSVDKMNEMLGKQGTLKLPDIMIVAASNDTAVDDKATDGICQKIKRANPSTICETRKLIGAGHEILIEEKQHRDQFLEFVLNKFTMNRRGAC